MKYKFALLTLLVVLISLTASTYFLLAKTRSLEEKNRKDETQFNQLYLSVLMHGESASLTIPKATLISDERDSTYQFGTVLGKTTYVFRVRENNCFKCVELFLPYLNNLIAKVGPENVILLGSFNRPESFFLAMKKYQVDTKRLYYISPSVLENNSVEKVNNPYIFQMDTSAVARNIFMPNKDVPELSRFYTNLLINNYK